jgi:integrase
VIRARKPRHLPVIMTWEEVKPVLRCLEGDKRLMVLLMYGAGLPLMPACRASGAGRECLRLRI